MSDPARTITETDSPRRYRTPIAIGGALAVFVFLAVSFNGHFSLLTPPPTAGDFYDVQARSLLHGHWDVPRASLAVEGFVHNGKVYEYFGPLPAFLRMPVVALTDQYDGRLGQISMLLAFTVALGFTARLLIRTRRLVLGTAPIGRAEQWAVGAFVFAVGAGSVLAFLASRSWVYHEAELWGAALALGAIDAVVAFTIGPSTRRLVAASALTTAALLSRGSVGAGPLVALGLILLAWYWPAARRLLGIGDGRAPAVRGWMITLAIAIPVAIYAWVNVIKFGTLFSLPFNAQLSTEVFPDSRRILAANGGSMFNPSLIPTNAWQYLGLKPPRLLPLFPWITFADPTHTFGSHVTAWTWTTSLPTTMPFLTALGLVGGFAIVRRQQSARPSLAPLRAVAIGATIATIPTLSYAYIAQRYLSDLMPVATLLAVVGLLVVVRWARERERARAITAPRVTAIALAGLLGFSVWCNVGLGVMYGRLLDGDVADHDRAAFVGFQYALNESLGLGRPRIEHGDRVPAPVRDTVFVQGDCAALYWSDGRTWTTLEGGEVAGRFRLRVRFPDRPTGWQPLVVSRGRTTPQWIATRVRRDGRVQFAFDGVFATSPLQIDRGREHIVTVTMDATRKSRGRGTLAVSVDGRRGLDIRLPNAIIDERLHPLTDVTVGRSTLPEVPTRFTGSITRLRPKTPLCDSLVQPS